jgi:serine/threonine-protein kinase ATR
MTQFSNVVEDHLGINSLTERTRCVKAIRELIRVAGPDSKYALPQVRRPSFSKLRKRSRFQLRACLQSAMNDVHLCDHAFRAWSDLLWVLDKDNLNLVVDQTFALIVHNWPSFSADTRAAASKTLETLRKKHNSLLQDRIGNLPSLASIPMLSKLENEIARLKAKEDPVACLAVFSNRCNDENAVVVHQALSELVPFLEKHQSLIHQSAISQKPFPALTALIRSLLDIFIRFADHSDILRICASCLGLIGALDPYRVETLREKKRIIVLSNFLDSAEVLKFAGVMLEEVVRLFQATSNTKSQGYLAWLMQELCKFCKFTPKFASTKEDRAPVTSPYQAWFGLDGSTRTALTPFLSSKYTIMGIKKREPMQYPIFKRGISHATWLRNFTLDLLPRAKEYNAHEIFSGVAKVIPHQDLSIDTFIVPFAVANIIIDGDEQTSSNIRGELLRILEADMQGANHVDATNIKQCSEVGNFPSRI